MNRPAPVCVLDMFDGVFYPAWMFDLSAEPVSDDELEAVLEAALRCSGGQLTRPAECWMATVVARHLADRLALAGLTVVRVPARRLS